MNAESSPLHHCEAEQAVLCAVLQGERVPSLVPDDFYYPAHRHIFEAVRSLESKGQPIDRLTVEAELQASGTLGSTVQPGYILSLLGGDFVTAHVDAYANQVRERSIMRSVYEQCGRVAQMVLAPGAKVNEVLDALQAMPPAVQNTTSTSKSAGQAAEEVIQCIAAAIDTDGPLLGIPTGFEDLNRLTLGWQSPDLIIVAGRPGMGKTAFALECALVAARAGRKVYFASLEMSTEQLMMRLLSLETGIRTRSLRTGRFPKEDLSRLAVARDRLALLPIEFDDTSAISDAELCRRVRRAKPDFLIVDYLQLMRSAERVQRKDLEIANVTGAMKSLAKDLKIPVMLLSQLNREVEKREDGKPRLSDLRESGAIEQDADLVLALHRDKDRAPETAEVICLKHRNGPVGLVRLRFHEELTAFSDWP